MDYEEILKTMSRWMEAYKPICDKDDSPLFQLEPPATEEEISAVEKQINRRLPDSLRTFFLHHSRYLKLTAYFSDDFLKKLPSSIHSLFSAFLELSLNNLPLLNQSCQECIQLAFIESEHPSAALLQNVLPLTWVPCGDLLVFDYSQDAFDPPVLYLDSYAAEYHLCVLGHSFGDFLKRYAAVGLCGTEDTQMAPFLPNKTDGIQSDCPKAKLFRSFFFQNQK